MVNLIQIKTIFKFLKKSIISFLFCFSIVVFAQNQPSKSTIKKDSITENELSKIAKDYFLKKEYKEAALILSKNYTFFSESLQINWLYAHVLSMNNDNTEAKNKFEKAISISPKNVDLQKDYVRFLYANGKIYLAESFMNGFIDSNFKDAEFLLMQANINFWRGDLKGTNDKINQIKTIYPKTEITKGLENQLKEFNTYYINTNFEYQTDSQPLDYFAHHITVGNYISRFFSPKLEISSYKFSPLQDLALTLKLSNQIFFDKLKLRINLTAGVYKNISDNSDWIGGINLEQELIKNISLKIGYNKNSLLGTIASTTFNLTKQDLFGEIDYFNKFILFHAGYNHEFYQDNNTIKSIASWIVSQPIKIQKFNFQFGYGYGYTDSDEVLFIYNDEKVGIYDPYFTPKEQQIHSALLILNYNFSDNLSVEAKGNYGWATVKNPYPNEYNNEIGGFYDETFTPLEYSGSINYSFSNNFSVKANYTHQETFFYKRDNINLGLNYTF